MNVDMLNENIERVFSEAEGYIKRYAEDVIIKYVITSLHTRIASFLDSYVKDNLLQMMDGYWEKTINKTYIDRMISLELEGPAMQQIDNQAKEIFNHYLHKHLQAQAKKMASEIKVTFEPR